MEKPTKGRQAGLITVHVRVTPDEHRALRDLVFDAGHTGFQSFFRTLIVEKLRAGSALPPAREPGHAT
jgi:hypothetical protein